MAALSRGTSHLSGEFKLYCCNGKATPGKQFASGVLGRLLLDALSGARLYVARQIVRVAPRPPDKGRGAA